MLHIKTQEDNHLKMVILVSRKILLWILYQHQSN